MKKLDFVKWNVKRGLHLVTPYTSVEVNVLNAGNSHISLLNAGRNLELTGNGYFHKTFERISLNEHNMGDGLVILSIPGTRFFVVDTVSGYFQEYSDFHEFNHAKFLKMRDKYTTATDRGVMILPEKQGDEFTRNVLKFAEDQKHAWFKKEMLRYIAQQKKLYTK